MIEFNTEKQKMEAQFTIREMELTQLVDEKEIQLEMLKKDMEIKDDELQEVS